MSSMKSTYITDKIFIINGGNDKSFTTGGIVTESGTVLFGCDDRLQPADIQSEVTAIFCCDYRRSNNAGILNFDKAEKYVNKNYLSLLTQPELWWDDPKNRWHLYQLKNNDDILSHGASNVKEIADNEEIIIGGVKVTALLTPGDGDFSMSYIVEDDGVKVIFCGGLLYKGGTVPYIYRLTQHNKFNSPDIDYHGFLGGIATWKNSLDIISFADILIPYLGGVIENVKEDIETFGKNIDELYNNYADISALNYYADCLTVNPDTQFKQAAVKEFPPYVMHVYNQCNIVRSKNGKAIAIDNCYSGVTDKLLSMIEHSEITGIDAMYITHYHDDHVDGCEYFREHFTCPIYADKSFADVIKNPIRYRLPCISPVSADVTPLDDGYTWRWEEFELTSFAFPGQTLYHGGLMVKHIDSGEVTFFAGDSFTPTGIDDYCAYNRNLLIPDEGFFRCLAILKKHMPDYVINQHGDGAFSFTCDDIDQLENKLVQRMDILSKLSVWDNINYAIDDHFVMAYPYEQDESDTAELLISGYAEDVRCEIIPPKQVQGKNIYGIRVYVGGVYLGQKICYIVNKK